MPKGTQEEAKQSGKGKGRKEVKSLFEELSAAKANIRTQETTIDISTDDELEMRWISGPGSAAPAIEGLPKAREDSIEGFGEVNVWDFLFASPEPEHFPDAYVLAYWQKRDSKSHLKYKACWAGLSMDNQQILAVLSRSTINRAQPPQMAFVIPGLMAGARSLLKSWNPELEGYGWYTGKLALLYGEQYMMNAEKTLLVNRRIIHPNEKFMKCFWLLLFWRLSLLLSFCGAGMS